MMDFWSALSSCQFGYMKMLQFREFFGQQTWSDPFSHFSLLKFVGWCCFSHPAWKTILGNIFHTENWETSPLSVASIWFHPAFVLICEVSHSITLGHVWFTASCDHSAVFFSWILPFLPHEVAKRCYMPPRKVLETTETLGLEESSTTWLYDQEVTWIMWGWLRANPVRSTTIIHNQPPQLVRADCTSISNKP